MHKYHAYRRTCRARGRGAAAVELALVSPLLVLLLLGVLEIGRRIEVQQIVTNAAREGGRLSSGGAPPADVESHVRTFLQNAGLPPDAITSTQISVETTHLTGGNRFSTRVTVTLPIDEVSWIPMPPGMFGGEFLHAEAVWARD